MKSRRNCRGRYRDMTCRDSLRTSLKRSALPRCRMTRTGGDLSWNTSAGPDHALPRLLKLRAKPFTSKPEPFTRKMEPFTSKSELRILLSVAKKEEARKVFSKTSFGPVYTSIQHFFKGGNPLSISINHLYSFANCRPRIRRSLPGSGLQLLPKRARAPCPSHLSLTPQRVEPLRVCFPSPA